MALNNSMDQQLAEQLAIRKAKEEYPRAAARLLRSYEHMDDDVWIVQVEARDNGVIKTPFYSVSVKDNTAKNVFPEHSNVFQTT